MTDKKQTYTAAGYQALLDELEEQKVRQEQNKKDISTARSFGDLSENSEYDEAKNEQSKIALRIAELEELIKNAQVVDESQIDSSVVGVGSFESDPFAGRISDVSPIGSALMGFKAGDTVSATLPNGSVMHITILSVSR